MIIRVNQELCAGCGVCVDSYPVEAIRLIDRRVVIADALCTQCEACSDACPNGAITALSVPARSTPIAALTVPAPTQSAQPEAEAAAARGLAPLAGAALAFLGREVAPRLADVLIAALERRFAQPVTTAIAPVSTSSRSYTARGRGERRQARYRRGRAGDRNHRERR